MHLRLLLACYAGAGSLGLAQIDGNASVSSSKPALHTIVKRDSAPLAKASSTVLSYADVVESTRDSVVTIQIKKHKDKDSDVRHLDRDSDRSQFDFSRKKDAEEEEEDEEPQESTGTGVVITEDGLIMTNNHVVEHAEQIRVRLRGSEDLIKATLVGRDPVTDIAIIKVVQKSLSPATLGDSTNLRSGDVVLAIGSPFGLEQTITMGIISATGRSALGFSGMEDFIQTDAAINPGNSGGPLMDGKGRVVGINTAVYWGQSIGFAVPVNLALKVADDLLAYGLVVRGFLGVHLDDMTPRLAKAMGLPKKSKGVVVTAVDAGEAAAKAGFLPSDIIIQVNGRKVENSKRFRLSMTSLNPGDKAVVVVKRGDAEVSLQATLGEPPEMVAARKAAEHQSEDLCEPIEGLKVSSLTTEVRYRFLLPEKAAGVAVLEDFTPSKGAAGLKAGDLILSINGYTPRDAAAAAKLMSRNHAATVMLKVLTGSKEHFIAVTVKPKPKP